MTHSIRSPLAAAALLSALAACPQERNREAVAEPAPETRFALAGSGESPAEAPRFQPVPRGLKGLKLGMTPEEVVAVAPELGKGAETLGVHRLREVGAFDPQAPQLSGKTTLGSHPSVCQLQFAVEGGLSRIACHIGFKDEGALKVAERQMLDTLSLKYGPPQKQESPQGPPAIALPFQMSKRTYRWSDAEARLELTADVNSFLPLAQGLTLLNESRAHAEAIEAREREAERQRQEEAERIRREERQRIDEGREKLWKDL